jgi:hypothetical protein
VKGLCLGDNITADIYFETTGTGPGWPTSVTPEQYLQALRGIADYLLDCGDFELGSLELGGGLELDGFKATSTISGDIKTINLKPTVWIYEPDIPETALTIASTIAGDQDKCEFRVQLLS